MGFKHPVDPRVGDHFSVAVQREHVDILFCKFGVLDRDTHQIGTFGYVNFAHTVAFADGQALPYVDFREIHLGRYVVDHRTRNIELGTGFDSFKTG